MANPADEQVDLKQRGPVAWTLISILVPFGLLFWLHKSCRQINFLNREAGRPQRLISPWWVSGPVLAMVALLLGLIAFVYSVGPIEERSTDPTHELTVGDQLESVVYQEDVSADDNTDDEISPAVLLGILLSYGLTLLVSIFYIVMAIIYLLKHVDGVVSLGGLEDDKAALLVMGILGLVVFGPLIAYVVYKSQDEINQALADRGSNSAGGPLAA